MKYKAFYWNIFSKRMKKSVKKQLGEEKAREVMLRGKEKYRELIERAPSLGRGNPFAMNMYFASVFIGLWLGSGKRFSPEDMADIMRGCLEMVRPLFGIINLNKPFFSRLVQSQMSDKYLKWYEKHGEDYPTTWKMTGNTENKRGVYYELHSCPICAMCENEGISEIMPPLCELDSLMFSMMHGRLIRNQMIASGGSMCDYWVVGDKER